MLGFDLDSSAMADEDRTHQFRTVSRYNSFERAVGLKSQYENQHGFRYKWVVVLRLDLVLLNPIRFDELDPNFFYVPYEPHWPDTLENDRLQMVHDVLFFSSSANMDRYTSIVEDIRLGKYKSVLHMTHVMTFCKLREMFPDRSTIRYGLRRYDDFEIYRFVLKPELNPIGHQYGALNVKRKMDELVQSIV